VTNPAAVVRRVARRVLYGATSPEALRWIARLLRLGPRAAEPGPVDSQSVQRVLVVRVDELGDLVLTTPLLRELKKALPAAAIDLVVRRGNVTLVDECPYLDTVFEIPVSRHRYLGRVARQLTALRFAAGPLAGRRYDLALVPRWDSDYFYNAAGIAYLSGARWRIGNKERMPENASSDSLFTTIVDHSDLRHEVLRALAVLEPLGIRPNETRLEICVGQAADRRVVQLLANAGVQRDYPTVGIAPGAGHPRRRWPVDRFAEVLRSLMAGGRINAVVIGGPEDRELGDAIVAQVGGGVANLAGMTDLSETAALLRHTQLLVGNDSGPIHIAATCGVPVVVVSCHSLTGDPNHANSPDRFHPWGVDHCVVRPVQPRRPCSDGCAAESAHCIEEVAITPVIAAAKRLLGVRVT